MSLPVVAIVGRPNVGKSSLLNALARRRIAIVDPTPGVTRDRISVPCPLGPEGAGWVELVDTGGIGIVDSDRLSEHVEAQIEYAIQSASAVVFLVDAREGVTPLDRRVAERLRRLRKPVVLVANKADTVHVVGEMPELHALGFGEALPVSATHSLGLSELQEKLRGVLLDAPRKAPPPPVMKLAVVGKRNAGKSTFINAIAGQDRVIVSEVPGTTRDSIDVRVELDGRTFLLIDTAGVRKRKSLSGDIEFYSLHRAMRSIRRADVAALMIDASVPVSQVDKDLAGQIAALFKPVVLVVNKWDLATGKAAGEDYQEYFGKVFPELSFAPISLTTATTGANVRGTLRLAEQLFAQAQTRVPTHPLNEAIQDALKARSPAHRAGAKNPKVLYASQIGVGPPTIVCFVNDVRSFDGPYQRFMLSQLRDCLPFAEVPIRLIFRQRRGKTDADEKS